VTRAERVILSRLVAILQATLDGDLPLVGEVAGNLTQELADAEAAERLHEPNLN
jgi:hypothetical protein